LSTAVRCPPRRMVLSSAQSLETQAITGLTSQPPPFFFLSFFLFSPFGFFAHPLPHFGGRTTKLRSQDHNGGGGTFFSLPIFFFFFSPPPSLSDKTSARHPPRPPLQSQSQVSVRMGQRPSRCPFFFFSFFFLPFFFFFLRCGGPFGILEPPGEKKPTSFAEVLPPPSFPLPFLSYFFFSFTNCPPSNQRDLSISGIRQRLLLPPPPFPFFFSPPPPLSHWSDGLFPGVVTRRFAIVDDGFNVRALASPFSFFFFFLPFAFPLWLIILEEGTTPEEPPLLLSFFFFPFLFENPEFAGVGLSFWGRPYK